MTRSRDVIEFDLFVASVLKIDKMRFTFCFKIVQNIHQLETTLIK